MSDAVLVKTKKFMKNPLLSRRQVCKSRRVDCVSDVYPAAFCAQTGRVSHLVSMQSCLDWVKTFRTAFLSTFVRFKYVADLYFVLGTHR